MTGRLKTRAGNRTVLITGASGGIGLELAKQFAGGGFDLVLVSRSADRLNSTAETLRRSHNISTTVIPCDLSAPGAVGKLVSELDRLSIKPAILVNNAGFGSSGAFHEIPPDDLLGMVRVNILALTELTRRVLPDMVGRGSGRILNVASTAAYQPGPFMAVYYASKAYVLSFSEALSAELSGTGITVTALCPGPTLTGFQVRAGMEGMNLFRKIFVMDAAAVAKYGYRGCMKGKRVVIAGTMNKLVPFLERFLPDRCIIPVVRLLHRRHRAY